jgi:RimJ/RimL family protein N-acetyltransferase
MILGNRLRLRAVERDDLPRFVAWLNDPEVRENLMLNLPLSMAQEERWFENLLNRPQAEAPLVIEILTADGWVMIGNVGLNEINLTARWAEVGIFIGDKKYWNQGYGRDALRLMLRHAFNNLNLNRVELRVYENNRRAIKSYENTGFVHEGSMRQKVFRNGKYLDELVMAVLRSEWTDADV